VPIPCTQGGNLEEKKLQGRISKEFFLGDKAKLVYFAGGKHLFTQKNLK
jgi:hypothetical protein